VEWDEQKIDPSDYLAIHSRITVYLSLDMELFFTYLLTPSFTQVPQLFGAEIL